MRELNAAEMHLVSGGDGSTEVEPIVVTAFNIYLVHQPSNANGPPVQGAKPGIGGGEGGGAEDMADIIVDWFAHLIGADQFSLHKIAERNTKSNFNRDTTNTQSSNGHNWWTEKSDGTGWFDLDNDGKPETHVKLYSDGSAFMDSDFNGTFDTKVQ